MSVDASVADVDPSEAAPQKQPHKPRPAGGIESLPLTAAQLHAYSVIIDVRSPAEFALDHLPDAINLPVLSNDERIVVGTLYKQQGAFNAKKVGAALVARNVAAHLDTYFADKPKHFRALIYCWRGGARSGALTHILRNIGFDAKQLQGGYKAWRAQLVLDIDALAPQFRYQVVCGRTGSGKSRLLEALARRGAQVLDLEQLAAHKGSILGDLPDAPQPSQKGFESLVWAALNSFDVALPVFVEAESKKVGAVQVPHTLMDTMRNGACFEAITPQDARICLLREEYLHLIENHALLFSKLDCLVGLHSQAQIDEWKAFANAKNWDSFVESMLVKHYDPAYERSMFSNYVHANAAAPVAVGDISPAGFDACAQHLLSQFSALHGHELANNTTLTATAR